MAGKKLTTETKYRLTDFYVNDTYTELEKGFEDDNLIGSLGLEIEPRTGDEIGLNVSLQMKGSNNINTFFIDFSKELLKLNEGEALKVAIPNTKMLFALTEHIKDYYDFNDYFIPTPNTDNSNQGINTIFALSDGSEIKLNINTYIFTDKITNDVRVTGALKISKLRGAFSSEEIAENEKSYY